MTLHIPEELAAKACRFPESSYGATTVTLILSGGRRINDIVLAGGDVIVKVSGRSVSDTRDLAFDVRDVVDVVPEGHVLRAVVAALKAWLKA